MSLQDSSNKISGISLLCLRGGLGYEEGLPSTRSHEHFVIRSRIRRHIRFGEIKGAVRVYERYSRLSNALRGFGPRARRQTTNATKCRLRRAHHGPQVFHPNDPPAETTCQAHLGHQHLSRYFMQPIYLELWNWPRRWCRLSARHDDARNSAESPDSVLDMRRITLLPR